MPVYDKNELIKYIEAHPEENRDDVAVNFFVKNVKAKNVVKKDDEQAVLNSIRIDAGRYIPKKQAEIKTLQTLASGGSPLGLVSPEMQVTDSIDTANYGNTLEVARKYKDIDLEQAASNIKNIMESQKVNFDEAAGLFYEQNVEPANIPDEQKNQYIEALQKLATYQQPEEKPSVVKKRFVQEANKYGNVTEGVLNYHKVNKRLKTYIEPTIGDNMLTLGGKIIKKEEAGKEVFNKIEDVKIDTEDIKQYNTIYDKDIYRKAKVKIESGRYIDEQSAIADIMLENYATKKLTEEEKNKIYANIKLAAYDTVPLNKIRYGLPTVGAYTKKVIENGEADNYDEATGIYYTRVLEPLLNARGASDKDKQRAIDKLIDYSKSAQKADADSPLKSVTFNYVFGLPFTNQWLTDAYTDDVDDITKAEYSKILVRELNDKTYEYEEGIGGVPKRLALDIAIAAGIAIGTKYMATAGKSIATVARELTYETVDNLTGNIISVGGYGAKAIGTKVNSYIDKKAIEELALKHESFREVVGDVAEYIERQAQAKGVIGLKKDTVQNALERTYAELHAKGYDVNPEKISAMMKEVGVEKLLKEEKQAIQGVKEYVETIYNEPPSVMTRTFDVGDEIAERFRYNPVKVAEEIPQQAIRYEEKKALETQLYNKYLAKYNKMWKKQDVKDILGKIENESDTSPLTLNFARNYIMKFADKSLEDMCGTYGVFVKNLVKLVDSDTELGFAVAHLKTLERTTEVLDNVIANPNQFMVDAAQKEAEIIASKSSYDKMREYIRINFSNPLQIKKISIEEFKEKYGEDFYKFIRDFENAQFGYIREMAVKVRPSVIDKKVKRSLVLKDRRADGIAGKSYEVYDKRTGKQHFFASRNKAEEFIDEKVVREFEPLENYAPVYLDFDKIKKNKEMFAKDLVQQAKNLDELSTGDEDFRKAIVEMMRKEFNISDKKADILEEQELFNKFKTLLLKDSKAASNFDSTLYRYIDTWVGEHATRRYGHLQFSRSVFVPEGYYKIEDIAKLDDGYRFSSIKRLTEIEAYGENDEIFNVIERAIKNDYGEKSDAINIYRRFRAMLFNRYQQDPALDKIVNGLSAFQAITKMPLSSLGQIQQIAYAPSRTSMKSFIKGLSGYITDRRTYKELLDELGFTSIEIRSRQIREEIGLAHFADKALKMYGMVYTDRLSRQIAALSGYHYAKELFTKFAANPKKYYKDMIDAGFDMGKLLRSYKETGEFIIDKDDILRVMQKVEIDTNFRNSVLDKPLFMSARTGRMFTALQSASIQQTRFVKRFVYDKLKEGNPYPLINLVAIGSVTGLPRQLVINYMRGDDVDPNFVDMAVDIGLTFGIYGNYIESLYYGMSVFGPNVSTVGNASKVAEALLHADLQHAVYYTLKEVPLVHKAVYRDKYVKLAEARRKREDALQSQKDDALKGNNDALRKIGL